MVYSRIKNLREDNDWTQQTVANKLFISRSTYSAYENGANAPPLEVLIQLAKIYNTSVDYLLDITNVREPYPPKWTVAT